MTTVAATKKRSEVKDPQLASQGKKHPLGRRRHAGPGPHPRPLRQGKAAGRPGMAACLHVTAETANLAAPSRPAAPTVLIASNPLAPRTTWPPALSRTSAFPPSPSAAKTPTPTTSTSSPPSNTSRTHHRRRRRLVSAMVFVSPAGSTTCIRRCGRGAEDVAGRARSVIGQVVGSMEGRRRASTGCGRWRATACSSSR